LERGCFTIVGPRARDLLQPLVEADLSNERFPWLTAQAVTIGFSTDVRMLRVNYEGELGWELYHPIADQLHLLDALLAAGPAPRLRLTGIRALEPLRLQKSHRALYRDIDVEHTALESGLDRFVKLQKGDFTGRDALLRQRQQGILRRLATVAVAPGEGDLV